MVSHPELGLDPPIGSDRESGCDRIYCPLALAVDTGEPVRVRYMWVIGTTNDWVVTLGIGMCKGVGE